MTNLSWISVLVAANLLVVAFGLVIAALSYSAYQSSGGEAAFRDSTIGFLLITVGGVLGPVYAFGIRRDFVITMGELLVLQVLEGSVIAIGLALLILSVYSHRQTSKTVRATVESDIAED